MVKIKLLQIVKEHDSGQCEASESIDRINAGRLLEG